MNNTALKQQPEPKWIIWLEWAALIAIVAVGAYLRYWRIEEVPPGFNSDEAVGAMGALTTLRQGLQYSYEGQGGGGALGFYFAAAFFYLFGPSVATIRGLTAWAGVMSIFANYWAMREMFREDDLTRARWIAGLSSLGLALSRWHFSASRVAFASIGVPFLMMPSVYFLWLGLNRTRAGRGQRWPFVISGIFLGGLMYIYLSGVMAPPLYAAFFLSQWLLIKLLHKFNRQTTPASPYLTSQFWNLFATALTATLLLLPMVYILLTRPELDPGATRASQAFFMNPQINQGDPWGLLRRSIEGNFGAYGLSLSWFSGQTPRLVVSYYIGLFTFAGFLISLWRSLRGRTAYLFILLWLPLMLLPSILSPDVIPHQLRTLGASPAVYAFVAVTIIWLFEMAWLLIRRLLPAPHYKSWAAAGLALALTVGMVQLFLPGYRTSFNYYFNIFPNTNDAQAAYHVYAGRMAAAINRETRPEVAFILPRNTAAGDVFRNFATDFLVELEQPPAAHYWVVDDEETLTVDLTQAAADHSIIRLVRWKTSKHTGADPKAVIPYYLQKYGHFEQTNYFEYFDIDTYRLETPAPNFAAAETLQPTAIDFGGQIQLTGYALGNADNVNQITSPQAASGGLLWLRLAWQKTADHPEDLKVSALLYTAAGQLVTQMDKSLVSNILQVSSAKWEIGAQEETYFLIPIPPATPPGPYRLELAVYGADSLARLPVVSNATAYPLAEVAIVPPSQPASVDDLPLALGVNRELAPGVTLLGFETLPGETVRAGDQLGASLIWQAGDTPPATDWRMALRVKAGEGQSEWPISEPVGLAGPGYPASGWQTGDVWRGWLSARIPPSLEPGLYELELHLAAVDVEPVVLPVGEFEITGWPRVFNAPQPQFELGADFNGQAILTGLDVETQTVAPGDTLPVRLYWQAAAEFTADYTAFVHLIGLDGLLYGQVDQTPGAGAFPTGGWLPGEYLRDEYNLSVADNAPPGDYQLEIGLYHPVTGERLSVCGAADCANSDNRVLWPGLTVK